MSTAEAIATESAAAGASRRYILEAEGLVKEFRGFRAVDGVSLAVRRGSIHALIGPNGAGKTTLFHLLTRFLDPTTGTIRFDGHDITRTAAAEVARQGMVRSFQISSVFPDLPVLDNVRVALQRKRFGDSLGFWQPAKRLDELHARAEELLRAVGLAQFAALRAGELSYGRKRALELATTLALEPKLLLLDEPMAGMGVGDIESTTEMLRSILGDRTILMVEHNLSVVASLSDRISVLARGQVLAEGDYDTISGHEGVIQAYIGSGKARTIVPGLAASACPPAADLPATPRLKLAGVNGWYGEGHVLHGIALDVREGELVTLLGRNGAGKTTTLRAIMGLLARRSGSIVLDGREIAGLRSREIARLGVGYVPEERGIFASLSVAENLTLPPVVQGNGMSVEAIHGLFPALKLRAASQGTKLSGGEQQMLSIARVLRAGARLLLLDEPTEGLAPIIVEQIGKIIAYLKSQGYTIVLVEQNLGFVEALADRHFILEQGRVVDQIAGEDFAADGAQVRRYLGV